MKLLSIATAISLALTATADLEDQHFTINYGSDNRALNLMSSIGSASRANDPQATALKEELRELRNEKPSKLETDFETVCKTSASFTAEIYPLDPENLHPQVAWAGAELDAMFDGPYPGDYNQYIHPDGFRVVRSDYSELPRTIKQWIDDHPEQKLFCVVDGVAFFAPGVILQMLGLFAGEGEGECKGQFPTDPEAYFQRDEERDVVFGASFLGTAEIGNTLSFQAVAQKLVRKSLTEKTTKDEL